MVYLTLQQFMFDSFIWLTAPANVIVQPNPEEIVSQGQLKLQYTIDWEVCYKVKYYWSIIEMMKEKYQPFV
jgi:hypothetical protein